ncbi:hypothetical protein PUN28_018169 [Cardiocondyla obscurior]|uniref:Uncharacterized protein n=1 Tax=Cardiocondyla obscurior TaxID=286306 RepID=A0AAW2EM05_9HYME
MRVSGFPHEKATGCRSLARAEKSGARSEPANASAELRFARLSAPRRERAQNAISKTFPERYDVYRVLREHLISASLIDTPGSSLSFLPRGCFYHVKGTRAKAKTESVRNRFCRADACQIEPNSHACARERRIILTVSTRSPGRERIHRGPSLDEIQTQTPEQIPIDPGGRR